MTLPRMAGSEKGSPLLGLPVGKPTFKICSRSLPIFRRGSSVSVQALVIRLQ